MYIDHRIITTWFGKCNFCFRKLNRKESRYGIVFDNKSAYGLELICSECLSKSKPNPNKSPMQQATPGGRWIVTPNDIEVLIHYHVCPEPHPRAHAPAVQDTIADFVELGILKPKGNSYITTERGDALVRLLCNTELPQQAWVDKDGNVILRTE